MVTDRINGSAALESTEGRARELAEAVERAHASDRRRIATDEIKQTDLFWVSEEAAKHATVKWRGSYRSKK